MTGELRYDVAPPYSNSEDRAELVAHELSAAAFSLQTELGKVPPTQDEIEYQRDRIVNTTPHTD